MRKLGILAGLATAAIANAQLIVGNDQSGTATLYNVNVNTGAATPIYSAADSTAKPWGMAMDNVNGVLYWNNGSTLYRDTYANLQAGTPNITSLTMMFNAATVNFVALGYNPNTGKLLGTRNIATEAVYEIDPLTGVATQAYVYSSTLDFGGIDFDDATGKLYGLSDTPSTARGLYEIDYVGGSETLIVAYPGGETDIDGLGVGGGKAYFVTDGPNTTQANFYVYNLGTNSFEANLPSPFTGSGTFSAAAYLNPVPEPATVLALMAGVGAMAARRRRIRD